MKINEQDAVENGNDSVPRQPKIDVSFPVSPPGHPRECKQDLSVPAGRNSMLQNRSRGCGGRWGKTLDAAQLCPTIAPLWSVFTLDSRVLTKEFKSPFELVLKEKLKLTALILCGAVLQSVLYWFFPPWITCLGSLIVLILQAAKVVLSNYGSLSTDEFMNVIRGRYTVQIPEVDGFIPSVPSARRVVVFIFAVRALKFVICKKWPGFADMEQQ